MAEAMSPLRQGEIVEREEWGRPADEENQAPPQNGITTDPEFGAKVYLRAVQVAEQISTLSRAGYFDPQEEWMSRWRIQVEENGQIPANGIN